MSREDAQTKGRRLLTEGRLVVEAVDGRKVIASCRGDSGAEYKLGWDPRTRSWRCMCEARSRCSHLYALQLVTVRPGHQLPDVGKR